MSNAVNYIPEGYHTITPYLVIKNAAEAIDFYKKALGAEEIMRTEHSDGRIKHAQIKVGDSPVMIADEFPEFSTMLGPLARGGTSVFLYAYVKDADALFDRAVSAGAKVIMPVKDQFYGDRSGGLEDPYGHVWWIATHIKDVTMEELEKHR